MVNEWTKLAQRCNSSGMGLVVKICGVNTPDAMAAALDAGADMVGLVFFRKSPRNVTVEMAAKLAAQARGRAEIVALTVDADDRLIEAIVDAVHPDWLQLHGEEPDTRIVELSRSACRIMKAIGVANAHDLGKVASFPAADRLLVDAKAPRDAARPGGNGLPFDWRLIAQDARMTPFMLSGGLAPENVATAIEILRGNAALVGVDVSSGVERAPGIKDEARISAFIAAARAAARVRTGGRLHEKGQVA